MLGDDVTKYIDGLSDDQLVAYVVAGTESYRPEAIAYAEQLLSLRNLSVERRTEMEASARTTAADREAYRTEGVGVLLKTVSFVGGAVGFGFLLIFAVAGLRYRLQGRSGKI